MFMKLKMKKNYNDSTVPHYNAEEPTLMEKHLPYEVPVGSFDAGKTPTPTKKVHASSYIEAHYQRNKNLVNLPRITLTSRQLCDLELLCNGGFAPLKGFLNKKDYESVVQNMRLANGSVWPIPVVLDVADKKNYKVGSEVLLCDEYNKPLAVLTVESVYKPNKKREAKFVYGTTDTTHFGVNYLFNKMHDYYIGGTLRSVNTIEHDDFTDYRLTPYQTKQLFKEKGWKKVIGFQTRNPLHKAHYTLIKRAAKEHNANLLLHPSVGQTKDGDIQAPTRIKCYIALHKKYINDFAALSLLPLAMRMGGPREAVWHAIIRKNYGCTHFVVGRDHAGPGKDKNGKPFYGPYDAQKLLAKYAKEIGITPIFFNEMVYVENKQDFVPADKVSKEDIVRNISGTQFRSMLANGEEIPEWFSFPEIINILRNDMQKHKKDGLTIFFTGLPSAGKSTLAQHLQNKLMEMQDKNITLLDGDVVRHNLSKGLGFSREDRNTNIARIGFVAAEVMKHRGIAICAAIAPFAQSRDANRALISERGNYVEVYVSTPLDTCVVRDVKGFYKMAKNGKLASMTGVDDSYEVPANPELTIDTNGKSVAACVDEILRYLQNNKLIQVNEAFAN